MKKRSSDTGDGLFFSCCLLALTTSLLPPIGLSLAAYWPPVERERRGRKRCL